MIDASKCQNCFSLPGAECGLRSKGLVLTESRGTGLALALTVPDRTLCSGRLQDVGLRECLAFPSYP